MIKKDKLKRSHFATFLKSQNTTAIKNILNSKHNKLKLNIKKQNEINNLGANSMWSTLLFIFLKTQNLKINFYFKHEKNTVSLIII